MMALHFIWTQMIEEFFSPAFLCHFRIMNQVSVASEWEKEEEDEEASAQKNGISLGACTFRFLFLILYWPHDM